MELITPLVILHFVLFPCFLLVASRLVFRLVLKLSPEDQVVLSQRFTRACIAVTLVAGGFKSLQAIFESNPPGGFSLAVYHPAAVYWTVGTVVYYIFDCLLLVVYR